MYLTLLSLTDHRVHEEDDPVYEEVRQPSLKAWFTLNPESCCTLFIQGSEIYEVQSLFPIKVWEKHFTIPKQRKVYRAHTKLCIPTYVMC
jgi:hypothetical protein